MRRQRAGANEINCSANRRRQTTERAPVERDAVAAARLDVAIKRIVADVGLAPCVSTARAGEWHSAAARRRRKAVNAVCAPLNQETSTLPALRL